MGTLLHITCSIILSESQIVSNRCPMVKCSTLKKIAVDAQVETDDMPIRIKLFLKGTLFRKKVFMEQINLVYRLLKGSASHLNVSHFILPRIRSFCFHLGPQEKFKRACSNVVSSIRFSVYRYS